MADKGLYIGQMSGTSLDGIDTVLVSFEPENRTIVHGSLHTSFPCSVRSGLKTLTANPTPDSALAQKIDKKLGELYAEAALEILASCRVNDVVAIGCHGQTILHRPDATPPFTWQIGSASEIVNRTKLTVANDFRTADMQVGGQGAPLAPAYHQYAFHNRKEHRAIVNIGGIANVTCLDADASRAVVGFDTGPGNSLLDQWVKLHTNEPFDRDGRWALSSVPDQRLLAALLDVEYFRRPAPKSLDIREFNLDWVSQCVASVDATLNPATVQRTLSCMVAETIYSGIQQQMPHADAIYVCGGGAHNSAVMEHLQQISGLKVSTTASLGVDPQLVEACAFAWLAYQRINGQPANLPTVTGARKAVMLGSVTYPSDRN